MLRLSGSFLIVLVAAWTAGAEGARADEVKKMILAAADPDGTERLEVAYWTELTPTDLAAVSALLSTGTGTFLSPGHRSTTTVGGLTHRTRSRIFGVRYGRLIVPVDVACTAMGCTTECPHEGCRPESDSHGTICSGCDCAAASAQAPTCGKTVSTDPSVMTKYLR